MERLFYNQLTLIVEFLGDPDTSFLLNHNKRLFWQILQLSAVSTPLQDFYIKWYDTDLDPQFREDP